MSWTVTGAASNSASSGATIEFATSAHGLTIVDGDLVIVAINTNNDNATIAASDGTSWTAEVDNKSDMSGETSTYSVLWLIASSEPANYTFTHGGSERWSISIMVATPDSGTPAIDVNAVHSHEVSGTLDGVATGITTAANSLGFCTFMDDNTGQASDFSADNGYTAHNPEGDESQVSAYQVDVAGGATSDITLTGMANSDKTYSSHMSWVHGGAPSVVPTPELMMLGVGV